MRTLVCCLSMSILLGVAGGCGRTPSAPDPNAPQELTLATSDGVQLGATLYPVEAPSPPSLVLVPMQGSDGSVWQAFAARAQRAGFMCIALDLRGSGRSVTRNGQRIVQRSFDTEAWLAAVNDIEAARSALLDHGASPRDIVVMGAGLGANLTLRYALNHPEIPAIVLLSPGLDYQGVTTETQIEAFGNRPILLMTSVGDAYASSSCTELKRAASGLCELRQYPGAAQGTAILDNSEDALQQVFAWLKPIVGGT